MCATDVPALWAVQKFFAIAAIPQPHGWGYFLPSLRPYRQKIFDARPLPEKP